MRLIRPAFYTDFHCVGGQCADNCCIGWEIDIDPQSAKKYGSEPGPLGEALRKSMRTEADGTCHFILDRDERCPFLNDRNLCSLICAKGEGFLCGICAQHPRFYNWYGDSKDEGLGLCCPQVCALLDDAPFPLRFVHAEDGMPADPLTPQEEEMRDALLQARDAVLALVGRMPIEFDRLCARLLCFAAAAQDTVDFGQPETLLQSVLLLEEDPAAPAPNALPPPQKMLELYAQTEACDEKWNTLQMAARRYLAENELPPMGEKEPFYRKLLQYMVFRHLSGCLQDGALQQRLQFCLCQVQLQRLLDAALTRYPRPEFSGAFAAAAYFSRQIEYSEENMELLLNGMSELFADSDEQV